MGNRYVHMFMGLLFSAEAPNSAVELRKQGPVPVPVHGQEPRGLAFAAMPPTAAPTGLASPMVAAATLGKEVELEAASGLVTHPPPLSAPPTHPTR